MPNNEQAGLYELACAIFAADSTSSEASRPFLHLQSQVPQPEFFPEIGLWLYGNTRLLAAKRAYAGKCLGVADPSSSLLDQIESNTEKLVLGGSTVVCGVHCDAWQRSAIVPLRWGSPRIVVFSGGFQRHLGEKLDQEPFKAARLWRYQWDPITDLAVSRKAPDRPACRSLVNPAVDRLVVRIAETDWSEFVRKTLREHEAIARR